MVAPVFANTDTRFKSISSRNRSKLATTIMGFGVHEGKKEQSNRASTNDLKRFLEREGFSRELKRRAVSISARHLSIKNFCSQILYQYESSDLYIRNEYTKISIESPLSM